MPKDTELYDLLGVAPEATDIEYAFHPLSRSFVVWSKLIA
jgi:curved DNA-binding protein CbpA